METGEPLALPLVAIMAKSSGEIEALLPRLEERFGAVFTASDDYDFDKYSAYYASEFGTGLFKRIVFFGPLREQGLLADDKCWTCALEREIGSAEKRLVNIDPGFLNLSKLVLASTKDHAHRIYLSRGIHAEVTLFYRAGSFQTSAWTYPDYRDQIPFLNSVRNRLRAAFPEADPMRYR